MGVPQFELTRGSEILGGMEKSTRVGFAATGHCFDEEWEVRVDSKFLRGMKVFLERPDRDETGGRFEGLFFGTGQVLLPGGDRLRWRHPFLKIYHHVLEGQGGYRLLQIRPSFFRFLRIETRIDVDPEAWGMAELPRLLLLSWFLRTNAERRGRRVF